MRRRTFLVSLAPWLVGTTSLTRATVTHNRVPRVPFPNAGDRRSGPWQFFTLTKRAPCSYCRLGWRRRDE